MQSKLMSAVEAFFSTIIGFGIAMTAQIIIFPYYGIHISMVENIEITGLFTVISIARQYVIRRLFNLLHKYYN